MLSRNLWQHLLLVILTSCICSCLSCKIYIVDGVQLLRSANVDVPHCNLDDPVYWPFQVQGAGLEGMDALPHNKSQHAGAFYFRKYLRSSPFVTDNLADANYVYVDQHCLYMWWLASKRMAQLRDGSNRLVLRIQAYMLYLLSLLSGEHAIAGFKGKTLLFYFSSPVSFEIYNEIWCHNSILNSILIVPEFNTICEFRRHEAKIIVSPHLTAANIEPIQVGDLSSRKLLLHFRGGCEWSKSRSVGQRMRWFLAHTFNGIVPGVFAQCSCGMCTGRPEHKDMMLEMRSSKFCMIIPGDTQTSRRLSEAILSGCIPVFIGPPFHTLPLSFALDWGQFSIFFNVSHTPWVLQPEIDGQNMQNWKLYQDVRKTMIQVENVASIVKHLLNLDDSIIVDFQERLSHVRSKFVFDFSQQERDGSCPGVMAAQVCNM